MIILGLESTCDESSAAVLDGPRNLLSNVVKSQIPEHQRFGGVVPEIASRLHLQVLSSAVKEALYQAKLNLENVDLIAFSHRPGLMGGLAVGATLAKTLSWLLGKPIIAVDHLLGHLMAPDIEQELVFPCVAGIFSGGHSNVYLGQGPTTWELLSQSRDDAPGESFDKSAKLMGLSYPGGPSIQKLAESGDEKTYSLPLPLPKSLGGDFSFSGLKTALLYYVQGTNGKEAVPENRYPDLAASFQWTVAEGLSRRLLQVAEERAVTTIHIGGGVAANQRLRELLIQKGQERGVKVQFPSLPLCMDNGAMIARAGLALYEKDGPSPLSIEIESRSSLGR